MKTKKAFNLAEIIVTLALIGILVAITIPSTFANYQKKIFLTKNKRNHDLLQSAFDAYAIETNYANNHLGGNDYKTMANTLLKYMNGKDLSYAYNVPYNNGKGLKSLDGKLNIDTWRQGKIELDNGTDISIGCGHAHWVQKDGENRTWVGEFSCAYYIDVNGEFNGPNVLGRDVFYYLGLHDGLYTYPLPDNYTIWHSVSYESGGAYGKRQTTCNEKTSSGYGCSGWFVSHNDYEK